jgi:riboflavin kinase/FMN adenylyltransferase
MQIFHSIDEIPADFGPTILTVGNFDGVHLAHAHVLNEISWRGRERRKRSMAVSFEPHPSRVLRPDMALKLITPTAKKLQLIEATKVDATLILPFTDDLSVLTPEEFASRILKGHLRADEVHEGANFRFGHQAAGDVSALREFGKRMGFEVTVYPEMRVRNQTVSSSRIRALLKGGEMGSARHLLGRTFSIQSTVEVGRGYGSKYTVPTVNLAAYDELVPKHGVYVTRTRVGEECFDSVTNVGNRPTFGAGSFAIESHLMNFHSMEITEETRVEIHFLKRLRNETKFPSVDALREQIGRDVRVTQRYFELVALKSRKSNTK